MQDRKILITGTTGQVGRPVALHFAKDNEVWAIARFSDEKKRGELESAGVRCEKVDLGEGDFHAIPDDFDYVLHTVAVSQEPWRLVIRVAEQLAVQLEDRALAAHVVLDLVECQLVASHEMGALGPDARDVPDHRD